MAYRERMGIVASLLVLTAVLVQAGLTKDIQERPGVQLVTQSDKLLKQREEYFDQLRISPQAPAWQARRSAWLAALELPYWTDAKGNVPAWEFIGPTKLRDGWGGYECAGRVSSIAVDPRNTNRIYVGASHGGVFKSTDRGASWEPLSDFEASLSFGSLVLDPFNPDIIYAGTGEAHGSGDSYFGAGFLRSMDAGRTWELLAEEHFAGAYWAKLIASPKIPGLLLAATSRGLFRSLDGGNSWTRLLEGYFRDVVNSPKQPDTYYACGGTPPKEGVFKTTDSGNTWELLGGGLRAPGTFGRTQLAQCRDVPNTVYVSYVTDAGIVMYRTDDGGRTWMHLPNAPNYGSWYYNFLACGPDDPKVVYAAGSSCFRSLDGGETWIDAARSFQWGVHPDWHGYSFDPHDPKVLYGGTDGGMFVTYDRGDTWRAINTGLANIQFETIGTHPWDPYDAIGGTQDNGTLKYRGNPVWRISVQGDGGISLFDYKNPSRAYSTYVGLAMYQSDDGGESWRSIADRIDRTGALFYAPYAMDPNDPRILVAGALRASRTTDGGDTWSVISGDIGPISAIGIAYGKSEVIYCGNRWGRMWVTPNTGEQWYDISSGLPSQWITWVAVDPRSPRRVIVGLAGFGNKHVFLTENAGGTWRSIDDNLPDAPVRHIAIDPTRPDDVYVALDCGVFVSNTGGGQWKRFGKGIPHTPVESLSLNRRTGYLSAATHGRGAWRIPLPSYKSPGSAGQVTAPTP